MTHSGNAFGNLCDGILGLEGDIGCAALVRGEVGVRGNAEGDVGGAD